MTDILVVEDNDSLRDIVTEALSSDTRNVTACASAEEAFEKIKTETYDLVITDLKLPEADGIAVLDAVKKSSPSTEVIVVTAYGTIDTAVNAMKRGATDFLTKPFSIGQIRAQAEKALGIARLKRENAELKENKKSSVIGGSKIFLEAVELAKKSAATDATVMITGESGTGKELIAQIIHESSKRANMPLVRVNCAALAPGVLESELFGHEKGAFTDATHMKKGRFELAEGGTIFLDEIAEISKELQVKLLRVIQEREFERVGGEKTLKADVRIIAATNKDLKHEVAEGRFREELYYRLNVIVIAMPSLRQRREDIKDLSEYFVKKHAEFSGFKIKGINNDAIEALASYDFPGNVRELENIIQRMLVTAAGGADLLTVEDVPREIKAGNKAVSSEMGLNAMLDELESKMINEALLKTGNNKQKAAELLKINRTTLIAAIKRLNLE